MVSILGRIKTFVCLFHETCRPNVGPNQPLIQWVPDALYRAEKRSERESNNLTPSTAEIKTAMNYTYAFMARTGTNLPVVLQPTLRKELGV
jgi:hypothetical protein